MSDLNIPLQEVQEGQGVTGSTSNESQKASVTEVPPMLETPTTKLSKIDYVLVSSETCNKAQATHEQRMKFLNKLKEYNVDIDEVKSNDGKWTYTLIQLHFDTLLEEADFHDMKLPLIPLINYEETDTLGQAARTCFKKATQLVSPGIEDPEPSTLAAPFDMSRRSKFLNMDDEDKAFTPSQRVYLTYALLNRIRFGPGRNEVGLGALEATKIFEAAYPLHDGQASSTIDDPKSYRQKLSSSWARFRKWYHFQPLHTVRWYFGERIALYYAWLGFYTSWLILPTIAGLVVFIYGLATFSDFVIADQVCDSTLQICPICNTCEKWELKTSCNVFKFSWLFDNYLTVPFAIFMSLWATLFCEFWKRKNAQLAFNWDMYSLEENEQPRPQFIGTVQIKDPITGKVTEDYPFLKRLFKYFASFFTILFLLTVVIIAVIGIIVYRIAVRISLFDRDPEGTLGRNAASLTAASAAVLNLLIIMILNILYHKLATIMTDWENHRTQTEYDDTLTFKIFLFQFVNTYSSIFYVAFFKGKFKNVPLDETRIFGHVMDACPEYGCMMDLTIQLVIIMIGKQFIGNFVELVVPYLKTFLKKRKSKKELESDAKLAVWEREMMLNPYAGLFGEYLEMILQFGFITLFVAAFPLAPLFALLNNVLEIRLDARKLTWLTRRPPSTPAEDIGTWEYILHFVALISVITNAFVISFTSDFIPRLVYFYEYDTYDNYISMSYPMSPVPIIDPLNPPPMADCHYPSWRDNTGAYLDIFYKITMARLAFVIVFEHFVFFVTKIIAFLIPDIPARIKLGQARESYHAQLALHGSPEGPQGNGA